MKIHYFILKLFALVTIYSFLLCPISASTKLSDDAIVAFVKGLHNFVQFCEEQLPTENKRFLAQFYGIHLGILHHMRKNWHSDNFRQQKCEKYAEYLDILYEYFFNVYAGHDVVKPIFVVRERFRPIREMELVKVVAHFADTKINTLVGHENYSTVLDLEKWGGTENYIPRVKTELKNEEELDYYYKKNEKETTEEDKLKRENFEEIMEKMLEGLEEKVKKKEEMAKENKAEGSSSEGSPSESTSSETASFEAASSEAAVNETASSEAAVNETASSEAAVNETASSEAAVNETASSEAAVNETASDGIYDIVFDLPVFDFDIEKKGEAFVDFVHGGMTQTANKDETDSNERLLVYLHLMKKIWQCEYLPKHYAGCPTFYGITKYKCKKNLRVLNIVFEYLFRVRYGIAAVKPIFEKRRNTGRKSSIKQSFDVLKMLNRITHCYFGHCYCLGNEASDQEVEITIINEEELNYTANSKNENSNMYEETVFEIVNSISVGNQMDDPNMQGLLRKAFKAELKALHSEWVEGDEEESEEEEEESEEEEEAYVEEKEESDNEFTNYPFWAQKDNICYFKLN